jgi:hypothetical protein
MAREMHVKVPTNLCRQADIVIDGQYNVSVFLQASSHNSMEFLVSDIPSC